MRKVVGFVVMMAAAAYLTRGLQLLLGTSKRAVIERAEEMRDDPDGIPLSDPLPSDNQNSGQGRDRDRDRSQPSSTPESPSISTSPSSVSLNGLAPPPPSQTPSHLFQEARVIGPGGNHPNETAALTVVNLELNPNASVQPSLPPQNPPPAPRAQLWAARLTRNSNAVVYTVLFLFVGLPVYFTTGYTMPAHLTFTVLCYLAALAVPLSWRQYLHPVLVTALFAFLGLWALAAVRTAIVSDGKTAASVHEALSPFRTGATYQALWSKASGDRPVRPLPGAGDVFATVLDAAIVALALPMYQYRRELRTHFLAIVAPSVAFSIASLFGYPAVCAAVGIDARRSLAFAARSLTLALAIPATENLGGDRNTVAAIAIMSGILGALVGERMLRWFRIPEGTFSPCFPLSVCLAGDDVLHCERKYVLTLHVH